MISLEMLGCEALPLEGMYQPRRHDVLTPQSSPEESHGVRRGSESAVHRVDDEDGVGVRSTAISRRNMLLDQPAFGLPSHIPEILYCKCRRREPSAERVGTISGAVEIIHPRTPSRAFYPLPRIRIASNFSRARRILFLRKYSADVMPAMSDRETCRLAVCNVTRAAIKCILSRTNDKLYKL